MIVNAFMPVGTQIGTDCVKWLFRRLDQKWVKGDLAKYSTKKTQLWQYIELYSGPSYFVHFKYSALFNIAFVTMFYGVGLPILFPIAVMSYVVFYLLERYVVAYTYQMPPSLDDKLTKNAVSVLKFAPLLMLFNGFWMLGNQQIFKGGVNRKEQNTSVMITGHDFDSIWEVDQTSPMILMAIGLLFILVIQKLFKKHLKKWGFGLSQNKLVVDENLPHFFSAVKLQEADWMVSENKHYAKDYGLLVIDKDLHAKLDDTEVSANPIQGTHFYRPLCNMQYVQDFAYISCGIPDRSDYIVDGDDEEGNDNVQSDLTCIVLNLAFLNEELAEKIVIGNTLATEARGNTLAAKSVCG